MRNHQFHSSFIVLAVIISVILMLFSGCGGADNGNAVKEDPSADVSVSAAEPRKVIIDTDTGADDASALILAAKSGVFDILGVTTLVGNVDLEQSSRNALAALEIAGCGAPVYPGSAENYKGERIDAFSVFGSDGMGDADLIHPKGVAQEKNAVDSKKKLPFPSKENGSFFQLPVMIADRLTLRMRSFSPVSARALRRCAGSFSRRPP